MSVVFPRIRPTIRRLQRTPLFTAFAVASIGLGIGLTTASVALVHGLLRPRDIRNIDSAVQIVHRRPPRGAFSARDYSYFATRQGTLSDLMAWTRFRQPVLAGDYAGIVQGELVTSSYFEFMNVEPELGRFFQPQDFQPESNAVVVISFGAWTRWFGGDPAVIGRSLRLAGKVFVVVGVAARGFGGMDMPMVSPTPMWAPISYTSVLAPLNYLLDNGQGTLQVFGRRRPDVSVEQVTAELAVIARQLDGADPLPRSPSGRQVGRVFQSSPAAALRLGEGQDQAFVPLMNAVLVLVVLVLLVACTNLANLVVARGSARSVELAVRSALGGSRGTLLLEQMAEGVVLCIVGGGFGLALVPLLLRPLRSTMEVDAGFVLQFSPRIDLTVLTAALLATMLTVLVAALIPAVQLLRRQLRPLLGGSAFTPNRARFRRALVSAQVGISILMLVVAAWAVQEIVSRSVKPTGLDLSRVAIAVIDFGLNGVDEVRARGLLDGISASLRANTSFETVALSSGLPVGVGTPGGFVTLSDEPFIEGQWYGERAELMASTPAIFRVLGIDLVKGHGFSDDAGAGAEMEGVVSETLAHDLFGDQPLGRTFLLQRQQRVGEAKEQVRVLKVVGVAGDTDVGEVGRRGHGTVYIPLARAFESRLAIVARVRDGQVTSSHVDLLRRGIRAASGDLAISAIGTGAALAGAESVPLQTTLALAGTLGIFAAALSVVGLYGLVAYVTSTRLKEYGIRLSLGSSRASIVRLIVGTSLRPVIFGVACGLVLSGLSRVLLAHFYAAFLPSVHVVAATVASLGLLSAATIACIAPARRASRIDPSAALRDP